MDYTAPDKSHTAPNNQWNPDEHNEMKAAINSKLDKSNVITSLANPQPWQVLSAQTILTLFGSGNGLIYQGTHNGTVDIYGSDFDKSGFWMPHTSFNSTVHSSYPVNKAGMLRVSIGNGFKTYEYITFDDLPRSFISVKRPGVAPSKWVELVTVDYLIQNGYSPVAFGGTPAYSAGSALGLSYNVTGAGNSDMTGIVTAAIDSGEIPTDEVATVRIEFQTNGYPSGVVITAVDEPNCNLYIASRSDQGFTVGATNFKEGATQFSFSYYVPPTLPS